MVITTWRPPHVTIFKFDPKKPKPDAFAAWTLIDMHNAYNQGREDMENQHRKIIGYRELDETEIALMNTVKALGVTIENLIDKIAIHQKMQRVPNLSDEPSARSAEQQRLDAAQPERWLAMGRTDLQTGLMKLTRAVAQPGFF